MGRLVEVHRDREHRADKDRAGDLRDVRAAPPERELPDHEDVHDRQEKGVADDRRGVGQGGPVVETDRVGGPTQVQAAGGLSDEAEQEGEAEHRREQDPRTRLICGDGPEHMSSPR